MSDDEPPPPPLAYYAPPYDPSERAWPREPLGIVPAVSLHAATAAAVLQILMCAGVGRVHATIENIAIFVELALCCVAIITGAWGVCTTRGGSPGRRCAGWGAAIGVMLGMLAAWNAYIIAAGLTKYM